MSRPLAALALLVLLLPQASAAPGPAAFPEAVVALGGEWLREAEAFGANDTQKPWYPEAKRFLDSAREMHAEGRIRAEMFDLETFYEIVVTGHLMEEAQPLPSDAERKAFAIQEGYAWHLQADDEWLAFRERLHAMENDVRSLQAMELVLYAADNALTARLLWDEHEYISRELPKQPGFPRDYLLVLVRADHTPLVNFRWANDVLDLASTFEGLPPRLVAENWTLMLNATMEAPPFPKAPTHLEGYEKIGVVVREKREGVMSLAVNLAEQRAARATSISLIFGDAQSRGKDALGDAGRGMNLQLTNTTLEVARDYGQLGVFTADAIDRALFTNKFIEMDKIDLGTVISAWAALDYQAYAVATLAAASPVSPPPARGEETPASWPLLVLAAFALVAFARRR